jgi:hypothetical protein
MLAGFKFLALLVNNFAWLDRIHGVDTQRAVWLFILVNHHAGVIPADHRDGYVPVVSQHAASLLLATPSSYLAQCIFVQSFNSALIAYLKRYVVYLAPLIFLAQWANLVALDYVSGDCSFARFISAIRHLMQPLSRFPLSRLYHTSSCSSQCSTPAGIARVPSGLTCGICFIL